MERAEAVGKMPLDVGVDVLGGRKGVETGVVDERAMGDSGENQGGESGAKGLKQREGVAEWTVGRVSMDSGCSSEGAGGGGRISVSR
jgi:hypothetical protein